ncbi:MAG: 50S ribosomal protein L24 [Thermoplasmata archaeon]
MAKSRSPRRQRRRIYQTPHHRRGKLLSAHLSPRYLEDRKVNYPRSLPLRKGDTVRVMRGSHEGEEGKVTDVDRNGIRVFVEGVTVSKADGTEVGKPIHPSNLMITKLDMTDPWRRRLIDRAGGES